MAGQALAEPSRLTIGEISYLNVLPLFSHARNELPPDFPVNFVQGHPSHLNQLLAAHAIDVAPASSFEYLLHPEKYRLLPDLSISADGPVQSVLLISPVPLPDLGALMQKDPTVRITSASASSVALLRILWSFAWRLPKPRWEQCEPGLCPHGQAPYLEIGDLALKSYLEPPTGWHLIDLAAEWQNFTGLPFVFAVWIVSRSMLPDKSSLLHRLADVLAKAKHSIPSTAADIVDLSIPGWLTRHQALTYWGCMEYGLGPRELAGLVLYGKLCRDLGLISGMPVLDWAL